MVLVVVGHTLGAAFPTTYLSNPVQIVLFSFHLPLFAAVSGFLMYGRESKPTRLVIRRFKALMVPYFTWYIVWWAVSHIRGDRSSLLSGLLESAISPLATNALWFLYSLFLVNVAFALLLSLQPSLKVISISAAVSFVLFVSGIFEGIRFLDPERTSWLYTFFALGYLGAEILRRRTTTSRETHIWSALIYAASVSMIWTAHADGTRIINLLLGYSAYVDVITRVLLVTAAGSACVFLWISFSRAPLAMLMPFRFIGVRSTGIYAMHKRLIFLTLELGFSGFWAPFVVALTGSTLLTLALERIPIMSNVFLGKNRLQDL